MDPLTAIGAVASIVQLAQAALSLSKTLYTLGAAVSSASEDIQALAQDLKTFSQSLTILSRLLEDSKSWYSDDVYLITARIIRDCAELYVKIDKILVKLGSNGTSTWKVRVKFVYQEGQIKKLMKQLRDMKGTLATILMSLQVDLQLSLLNISSSSKLQRSAEKSLEPETLKALRDAQKSVAAVQILSRYSENPEEILYEKSARNFGPSFPQRQRTEDAQSGPISVSMTAHSTSKDINPDGGTCSNVFNITQSVFLLPSATQMACFQAPQEDNVFSKASNVTSNIEPRSIKSSSSTESFKSAISLQEMDLEVARQVKAIQSLMHAFRTALEVLRSLIENRMPSKTGQVYISAKDLQDLLRACSKEINDKHIENFKEHGISYIENFKAIQVSAHFQEFSSTIMREVVMKLHELSAEHVDLTKSALDALCKCSKLCSRLVLLHLHRLAIAKAGEYHYGFSEELPTFMDMDPIPSPGTGRQFQGGTPIVGHTKFAKHRSEKFEEEVTEESGRLDASTDQQNLAGSQSHDALEWSLPFIGYTFKRFDGCNITRTPPTIPTSRDSVQTTESLVPPSQLSSPHQARVLQDYQMSLLQLEHQNKKRTMYARETSGPTRHLDSASPASYNSDSSSSVKSPRPKTNKTGPKTGASCPKLGEQIIPDLDLLLHPSYEQDILQSFDFDSFLFQDEEASKFQLLPETVASNLPAPDTPHTPVHSSFCFPATEEDPPRYINAKQFHRILRRRTARRALEEESASQNTRLLLSERRHGKNGDNHGLIESTKPSSDSMSSPTARSVRAQDEETRAPSQVFDFSASSVKGRQMPVDTYCESPLAGPKRLRRPGASARFRAHRREKEREAAEKAGAETENGSKEKLPGPSPLDLSFIISPSAADKPHAEPPSPSGIPCTCVLSTISSHSPSTKPSSRLDACLSLYTPQEDKLWWRSYTSIHFANFSAFEILYLEIFIELGISTSCTSHDDTIYKQISGEFKRYGEICLSYKQQDRGLAEILEIRSNVLRVVKTIDEQLGLQVATLGWSCVCVFLRIYERILVKDYISQETIEVTNKAFAQLQDLVAIIARYSVMENLYQKSGSALALKQEYQSALLSLCTTLLEYFAFIFKLGRAMDGSDRTEDIQGLINACGQLTDTIRDKDKACQGFRVVVEVRMESESENEEEIEDVSDDSWEEVGISSSEHGLIDLDAANV